jgi:uncharacterized protein YjbI with pentapeptide repeats
MVLNAQRASFAVLFCQSPLALFGAFALWLGISSINPTLARATYDEAKTAEGWAWSQIKQGEVADFNQHCGTPRLEPKKVDDARWRDGCRKISSGFLEDLLKRSPRKEQDEQGAAESLRFAGIQFIGARIVGVVGLEDTKIIRTIKILDSQIEAINLRHAHTDSVIVLDESLINGKFDASGLHAESDLSLAGVTIKGRVNFYSAKIDGDLDATGANFDGQLDADALQVGGSLLMRSTDRNKASFKHVVLRSANIKGQIDMTGANFDGLLDAGGLQGGASLLMRSQDQNEASFKVVSLYSANIKGRIDMTGASFDGELYAYSLQVEGDMLMRSKDQNKASFRDVYLRSAKITGQINMSDANFDGQLYANSLQVGDFLLMRSASFKEVNLVGAKIAGQIDMTGASFSGTLDAYALQVGTDLFMRSEGGDKARFKTVYLGDAKIAGKLDLCGATIASLDLSDASIARDFKVGEPAAVWKGENDEPGDLNLRNTHIGNLMDVPEAWPEAYTDPAKGHLHLDGFTFGHLGGYSGGAAEKMRERGPKWWDDWARRDPNYSLTPYSQLAAALTAQGDRDAANEILYLGREREREIQRGFAWLWSGYLQYVRGFGIGVYSLRIFYLVLLISLLGALYLRTRVKWVLDNHRGFAWCFGASLTRLLPIFEINKEFTDFFNDPKRERLTSWQSFIFNMICITGWVLGAALVAAISTLTQSS